MNYRTIIPREIQDMLTAYPAYSEGEVLYTILRELKIKKLSEIMTKSGEEIYTAINKAKEFEKEIEVIDPESL